MNEDIQQSREKVVKLIAELAPEESALLKKVLQLEQEHLYLDTPHVKQELLKIVREVIQ